MWRPVLLSIALAAGAFGCAPPVDDADRRAQAGLPEEGAPESRPPETLAIPDPASYGRIIYVSAYSHIYHTREGRDFPLTVNLSIRNPFPGRTITITRVDYFDSSGALVRSYLDTPRSLGPLGTIGYVVAQDDEAGGVGASFLVGWEGADGELPPLVETVMIGTEATQGISFTASGVEIVPD